MQVRPTDVAGVVVIEPQVHADHRGFFLETYQKQRYRAAGIHGDFVQDNHSKSRRNTLRGLHYQLPRPQGKLLWVVYGEVYDVVVDLRQDSPTFGRWTGVTLSASNRHQVFAPPGMAHGFCVLSDVAEVVYKCTEYYHPEQEHVLRWDDEELAIEWPTQTPIVSDRDGNGLAFRDARYYDPTTIPWH
ncbi:MAG: dTDP-4-dehydrorhamnose 3,5-epimerase [Pirellulales bacterium]